MYEETYDEIQDILTEFGKPLIFVTGTILGISAFYTEILSGGDMYPIEQQCYNFQIASKDMINLSLKPDAVFTMDDAVYRYTFVINNVGMSYLDGWNRIFADMTKKELL